jgi:periplasmic divalent cation tolerance protein
MGKCLVYITASGPEEARRIGRALVTARLAACANVFGGISSIYWWEGEVQEDVETALIVKTREALVPAISEKVREIHSYDCPCVVALPVGGGNPAFLEWIESETRMPE